MKTIDPNRPDRSYPPLPLFSVSHDRIEPLLSNTHTHGNTPLPGIIYLSSCILQVHLLPLLTTANRIGWDGNIPSTESFFGKRNDLAPPNIPINEMRNSGKITLWLPSKMTLWKYCCQTQTKKNTCLHKKIKQILLLHIYNKTPQQISNMTFTQNDNLPLVFLLRVLALHAFEDNNKVPMCHIETLHRRCGDLLGAFFTVRLNHTA